MKMSFNQPIHVTSFTFCDECGALLPYGSELMIDPKQTHREWHASITARINEAAKVSGINTTDREGRPWLLQQPD